MSIRQSGFRAAKWLLLAGVLLVASGQQCDPTTEASVNAAVQGAITTVITTIIQAVLQSIIGGVTSGLTGGTAAIALGLSPLIGS